MIQSGDGTLGASWLARLAIAVNLWVQPRKPVSVKKKKIEADIHVHLNMYMHTHICLNMYTHRGTCSQINKCINEGRVLFKEGSGRQLWISM